MKCPDSVKRLLEIPFIEIRNDFEKLRNGWSSSNLLFLHFQEPAIESKFLINLILFQESMHHYILLSVKMRLQFQLF